MVITIGVAIVISYFLRHVDTNEAVLVALVAAIAWIPLATWRARQDLPSSPVGAQRYLNSLWMPYALFAGIIVSIPLGLAARFGDSFSSDNGKNHVAQVLGVTIAIGVIEIVRLLDPGAAIDERIGLRSRHYVESAFAPQFDDYHPPGPIAKYVTKNGKSVPTLLWVYSLETANIGWDHSSRTERAKDLRAEIAKLVKPGWVPVRYDKAKN